MAVAETESSTIVHRRWCIFTSAGNHNAIRLWLKGDQPRRWDLVTAYYADDDQEFSEISAMSSYAFRTKGGKFQNLKKLTAQNPKFFDQYSYVWVCDDDIRMSAVQIDEAFAITERFEFWIAQPAFLPEGKNSHPMTIYAGPHCDYRIVNYIETGAPIFRRDKLVEFLAVYDGSLTGFGIDYWFMNFFRANELGRFSHLLGRNALGRFAIIDKVQVINPHDDEKGGREIERLQPAPLRVAAYAEAMAKYGLVHFRHKVFASRKISSHHDARITVTSYDAAKQTAKQIMIDLARLFEASSLNALEFRYRLLRARTRFGHSPAVAMPPQTPTLAEQLGYDPHARLLIVHADDLGFANAVNAAFITGHKTGLINSGSVMVPCRRLPEIVAFAEAHPDADLGIHLTLTSERPAYRWGPIAPPDKVPSLIDRQGYFHPTWKWGFTRINSEEVEVELRAQIEKAYKVGLRPTHLDSHQYRLQRGGPRLFEVYLRLGREYDLPIFVARDWFTEFPYLQHFLTPRDVVIDHTVTIWPGITPQKWATFYGDSIASLRPGVTQLVIHPGLDNEELQALCADRPTWGAAWRQRDLDFFTSEEFRALLTKHDISLITWREIATRFRVNARRVISSG
jgi:chitin disaccharide deacetylase